MTDSSPWSLKIIKNSVYLLSGIQTLLFVYYTLFVIAPGRADEYHFIHAIDMVNHNGWSEAVQFGVSIPYVLLTYPFSLLFPTYLALRLTNLLLMALFFWYLWKIAYTDKILYAILLSYISTVSFFLFGTNDTLFIFGLAVFFIETYTYCSKGKMNYPVLAFSCLVISIFTRQMVVFYVPIVLLSIYYLFRTYCTPSILVVPLLLALVLLTLNAPALMHGKPLSYDNKKAPDGFSWTQMAYLSTIESNQHLRTEGDHPSWEEVKAYLNEHGENSLPKTQWESMFFDFKLTLLEFPENLVVALKGSIRQIGVFLFMPILALLFATASSRKQYLYVIGAYFGTLCIFSFVILSIVELRWLGAAALLTLVASSDMLRNLEFKIGTKTINTNQLETIVYASYVMLSLYGITTYSKLLL